MARTPLRCCETCLYARQLKHPEGYYAYRECGNPALIHPGRLNPAQGAGALACVPIEVKGHAFFCSEWEQKPERV